MFTHKRNYHIAFSPGGVICDVFFINLKTNNMSREELNAYITGELRDVFGISNTEAECISRYIIDDVEKVYNEHKDNGRYCIGHGLLNFVSRYARIKDIVES